MSIERKSWSNAERKVNLLVNDRRERSRSRTQKRDQTFR
jgi:hypothetical protein